MIYPPSIPPNSSPPSLHFKPPLFLSLIRKNNWVLRI